MNVETGVVGLGLVFGGMMLLFLDASGLISTANSFLIGSAAIAIGVLIGLVSLH